MDIHPIAMYMVIEALLILSSLPVTNAIMFITMPDSAKIQIRTNITMAKVDLKPIKIIGV